MSRYDLGHHRGMTEAVKDALKFRPKTLREVCEDLGVRDDRLARSVRSTMNRLDREGEIVTVPGDDGRPVKFNGSFVFRTALYDGAEILAPVRPRPAVVDPQAEATVANPSADGTLPASQRRARALTVLGGDIVPFMRDWISVDAIVAATGIDRATVCEALREGMHVRPPVVVSFLPSSQRPTRSVGRNVLFLPSVLREVVGPPLRIEPGPRVGLSPVRPVRTTVLADVVVARIPSAAPPRVAVPARGPSGGERALSRFRRGVDDVEGLVLALDERSRPIRRLSAAALDLPVIRLLDERTTSPRLANAIRRDMPHLTVRDFVEDETGFRRRMMTSRGLGAVSVEAACRILEAFAKASEASQASPAASTGPGKIASPPAAPARKTGTGRGSPLDFALRVVVAESSPTPALSALMERGALRDVTLRDYVSDRSELVFELAGRFGATMATIREASSRIDSYLAERPSIASDFGAETPDGDLDPAECR